MSNWYYVQGRDRVGPVSQDELENLISNGTLNEESFVWKKGFDNWEKMGNVDELKSLVEKKEDDVEIIQSIGKRKIKEIDWKNIKNSERVFTIKVGPDRGGEEVEYGPYSLDELKRAYDECRINAKTFIYTSGMENWMLLGDLPIFEKVFQEVPPPIEEADRRQHIRRPFVARLLFHDGQEVFEGICRDVSVGGLQVLVSNPPFKVGDEVTMNVHPDNTDFCFAASGKIVRLLDGEQGFSLRFSKLGKDAQQAITTYLEQ